MRRRNSLFFIPYSGRARRAQRGQTALAIVFVIGGIIILIGTSLAFIAITFLNSTLGFQRANKALSVASAGVHDGLLQLARDKDFSDGAGYCVPTGCPTNSASVTVAQDTPSAGSVTITSDATVERYRRKIQTVASVDATTGEVSIVSWQLVNL